jgi:serine/threonine protein kinase
VPEEEARKILRDVTRGFKLLVKAGIIHRDLKPENILCHKETFKIADFGFARQVDNFRSALLTSLVGTPLYMSPQILKSEHYSTKSDIWSIGLIYYEMLFGKTPWSARSQYDLIKNIENVPLKFPYTVSISEESKDLLKRSLQIEERNRLSWEELF